MQTTVIKPTQAGDTQSFSTDAYARCVVSADVLDGTKKVTVNIYAGNTPVAFVENGAVVTLTNALPSRELPVGPTYQLVLDSGTAANCGVYADLAPR